MTIEELMNLPHLSIAEQKRLIHLHTEEGYLICNYAEGMDMLDYLSTDCLYAPVKDEYVENYATITLEQDAIYRAMQEEAIRHMEEEINSELN